MKKLLKWLLMLPTLTITTTSNIACNNDNKLKEKDKFIPFSFIEKGINTGGNTWSSNIADTIVLNFIYALPKPQSPHLDRSNFTPGQWNWSEDEMIGYGKITGKITNP